MRRSDRAEFYDAQKAALKHYRTYDR